MQAPEQIAATRGIDIVDGDAFDPGLYGRVILWLSDSPSELEDHREVTDGA